MARLLILALAVAALVGCSNDKAEPPLTTDRLDTSQVTTEPGTGTNNAQRPQANPNARFKPTR